MKKYRKPLISLGLLFLIGWGFLWCLWHSSLFYHSAQNGNMSLGVNYNLRQCYVSFVRVSSLEAQEIVIPDSFNGRPITTLGGYFGTGVPDPFCVDISGAALNAPKNSRYRAIFDKGCLEQDGTLDQVVEIPITIYLGKNISQVSNVGIRFYYPHINEDGSVTFYYPRLYFVCSEDNRYFYSEDGILYHKNGALVQELCP